MIESLIFSIIEIRSVNTFARSIVIYFTKNSSRQYTKVLKTILQYFKATCTFDIIYGGDKKELMIKQFFDSNRAGDHTLKKSIFGFIIMLNRDLVYWFSKKQATVVLLLTNAKYVALTLAA